LAYQKILEKLLAKDPEQRFQRGRELIAAIEDMEKNYRAPSTTATHPADLTVMNLAAALLSATYNAIRWRWNKIRALRWNPTRGFYQRPATKITEIFFNEQHTPALTVRAEIETQIHQAYSKKNIALAKLGICVALLAISWCTFSVWYAKNASLTQLHSIIGRMALSTADIFIALPVNAKSATSAQASTSEQSSINLSSSNQNNTDVAPERTSTSLDAETTLALDNVAISSSDEQASAASSEASSAPLVTYALSVAATPAQARIRILNIPDRYQPGIQLPAGRYHIEVSHSGYDTQTTWVEIIDQGLSPTFVLNESIAPGDELSSQVITSIKSKGPEMISISTGSFYMGNKDNPRAMPVHKVTINRPFAISKYEITFDDYDMFAQATKRPLPSDNRWGRGNRPVINVSFADAQAYAYWLSQTTGKKYRLPTESEWEYVARADTTTLFWWGNEVKDSAGRANCRRGCNSKFSGLFGAKTAPVGSYPANAFGVFDTSGNVAEWVEDCFTDNYSLHPRNGQAMVIKKCDNHVVRGGSAKDNAERLANYMRDYYPTEVFDEHLGFRVVMELH
jgi:serine/threonine-protein kinase PpkA